MKEEENSRRRRSDCTLLSRLIVQFDGNIDDTPAIGTRFHFCDLLSAQFVMLSSSKYVLIWVLRVYFNRVRSLSFSMKWRIYVAFYLF